VTIRDFRNLVLDLLLSDKSTGILSGLIDPQSPDGDEGKFVIAGKPARVIHRFRGWHVPVNLSWFQGGFDPPSINGNPFYWYVFGIPHQNRYLNDHYFIYDYLQMREWVLNFSAPLGNNHQGERRWLADLWLFAEPDGEKIGYFRWLEESRDTNRPGRVFQLDNLETVSVNIPLGLHVGSFGIGGESTAHKLLKRYVAQHQTEFGLSANATPHLEYSFSTGDRVDVLSENHNPDRTVVEIEVEGQDNICVGIHQAIKYRSLAAADAGFPLLRARVRSLVVAYDAAYPEASKLAEKYEIELISVNKDKVLATAV